MSLFFRAMAVLGLVFACGGAAAQSQDEAQPNQGFAEVESGRRTYTAVGFGRQAQARFWCPLGQTHQRERSQSHGADRRDGIQDSNGFAGYALGIGERALFQ